MGNENMEMPKETNGNTNQPIVNTDAAKAKANELAGKAKEGMNNFKSKMNSDAEFKKKVMIIAGVVVAVLLLGVIGLNGGAKGAMKGYINAFVKSKPDKVVKYMSPDYLEWYEDKFDKEYKETLEDTFDEFEDADGEWLEHEITDKEKVEKDDVEKIAKYLEDLYDIKEKDVKKAVIFKVRMKVDSDDGKDTIKQEFTVVKIRSKWCVFSGNLVDSYKAWKKLKD